MTSGIKLVAVDSVVVWLCCEFVLCYCWLVFASLFTCIADVFTCFINGFSYVINTLMLLMHLLIFTTISIEIMNHICIVVK